MFNHNELQQIIWVRFCQFHQQKMWRFQCTFTHSTIDELSPYTCSKYMIKLWQWHPASHRRWNRLMRCTTDMILWLPWTPFVHDHILNRKTSITHRISEKHVYMGNRHHFQQTVVNKSHGRHHTRHILVDIHTRLTIAEYQCRYNSSESLIYIRFIPQTSKYLTYITTLTYFNGWHCHKSSRTWKDPTQ